MSNPENIIRPAVLNATNTEAPRTLNISDLNNIITETTSVLLQQQLPGLIQSILNPSPNIPSDQGIDEQYRGNFADFDKIPDIVKSLREFSGNQSEFNSWRKSVERILQIYEPSRGTPRYYGILSIIRNKIVGNADIALESYNTPLDWKSIIKCLSLHYSDKRDLATLEYQMISLVQGKLSIQDFYQVVYKHLSIILSKLGSLEASNESLNLLTESYRNKALDTFIRGLNGDLPKLLGMREPVDLPQALHLCLKLENQSFRSNYSQNFNYRKPTPPLPPRNYPRNYQPQLINPTPRFNQHNFYPQLAHLPHAQQKPFMFSNTDNHTQPNNHPTQPQTNPNHYHQFDPPRPIPPKPQNLPQPMDVDSSLHSKRVNYMNRPQQQNANKRSPPSMGNSNYQSKIQRNFHIDNDLETYNDMETYNDIVENTLGTDQLPSEVPYNEDDINQYSEMPYYENDINELSDIHFLE